MKPENLFGSPNALAPHYSRFRVSERLLLTGHSHQAWPDCGFEGQSRAWLAAAEHVDDKWDRACAVAERVRQGFARLLDDSGGHVALGANTHELAVRFLSALPLLERPRLVTTDGEFHTLRRQLDRLGEEGTEIVKVASHPVATVADRLADAVDDRTAAAMFSTVFYEDAQIVSGAGRVLAACKAVGAHLFLDVYHALNVVPFSVRKAGLESAFIVGGGYKYCQLGEGNCFMRFPADCSMRPLITGWYSEFDALASPDTSRVVYGEGPSLFAGATYDPTSHYRAAAVLDFFEEQGLTPELLREVSQHQVGLLAGRFDELDADPEIIDRDRSVDLEDIGGFLALRCPRAGEVSRLLRGRGVFTDYRGDVLRLGPAPYLSDEQLISAIVALGEAVGDL